MDVQTPEAAARGADGPAQAPPGYPSPREAFESRRKAVAARDWRASFASSTPEVQGQEIENLVRYWLWMESGCIEGPGPEDTYGQPRRSPEAARLAAIMKKRGLEFPRFSPLILWNEEKLIKNMASRVADKATFYEEASELIWPRGKEAPELIHDFGDLQGVAESGDTADGWIVWTCTGVPGSVRLLRKFRRVDGRWFNDSETWDYTHRPWTATPAAQGPPGYASPREAFEARRKALAERDWRTSFASSTPEVQGQEVENLVWWWFYLGDRLGGSDLELPAKMAQKARFTAFMKKNGVSNSIFGSGGGDIEGMASRVPDKAAFYEEASEYIRTGGMEAPDFIYDFGDLQGVEVSGDAARGWVVWNRDHVYENGVKKVTRSVRLLRKFRRVGGRWFNNSRICDYTEFDANTKR
jgi:hypothetical protein